MMDHFGVLIFMMYWVIFTCGFLFKDGYFLISISNLLFNQEKQLSYHSINVRGSNGLVLLFTQ